MPFNSLYFILAFTLLITSTLGCQNTPKKEPLSKTTAKTKTADLLKHVDVIRDATKGKWTKFGNVIKIEEKKSYCKLQFPYEVEGDYQLNIDFARTKGNEMILIALPVKSTFVGVMLSGWGGNISGLHQIGGKGAESNSTRISPGKFDNNKIHHFQANVKYLEDDIVSIKINFNKKQIISWAGSVNQLKLNIHQPNGKFPAFVVHHSHATLHKAKLILQPNQ